MKIFLELAVLVAIIGHQGYLINKITNYQHIISHKDDIIVELEDRVLDQEEDLYTLSNIDFEDLSIENMFRMAAAQNDVDFKLLYAIAIHETGHFTSNLFLNKNNPGGLRNSDGWLEFNTPIEGIFAMASVIRKGYCDQGMLSPWEMQSKYCPNDPNWAEQVVEIMKNL